MDRGRPTIFTEEVISKLEEAFAMDCTIMEACLLANISHDTYHRHTRENKELSDRFEELRNNPFLKARRTIVNSLDQPEHAKWYMERKKKSEFAHRTENTGAGGGALVINFDPSFKENDTNS